MNIPFLILAQVITAYTYPPDDQGGRITDIRIESMADPLLDYMSRMDESQKIGQAVRTGQVYDPFSGQTMIKTQAPPNLHYNMSYEEAAKRRAIESENLAREVNIRSAEFKQKADAMDYKYRLSEIDQSEKYLSRVPELDPKNPEYLVHRAKLDMEFPIGALNSEVQRKLALLDQTYNGITQNDRILNRQQELAKQAELEKDINRGREMAAKLGGNRGLAMYEELLQKSQVNPIDPNKPLPVNPIQVIASMIDAQEQESRLSQLKELKVDEKQFYTPEIGPDGQRTDRELLDIRRVDAFVKTYPTASQAAQASAHREKMRANHLGETPDKWDPADQAEYNFHGRQIQRYESLTGQSKEEKAAPAIKSVDDFF